MNEVKRKNNRIDPDRVNLSDMTIGDLNVMIKISLKEQQMNGFKKSRFDL